MSDLRPITERLSVPSRQLVGPGPDPAQLQALLTAAIRVPDHGRLNPFRLVLIRGEQGHRLGEQLAQIHARIEPEVPAGVLAKDRERFASAPLVVTVAARLTRGHKVPEAEQRLTAGCVAYNLLLGAQALGFGAQWLTGWPAYAREVATLLGLGDDEEIVGFIHIGNVRAPAMEHARPVLADLLAEWNG
jgi:nitroreductase